MSKHNCLAHIGAKQILCMRRLHQLNKIEALISIPKHCRDGVARSSGHREVCRQIMPHALILSSLTGEYECEFLDFALH